MNPFIFSSFCQPQELDFLNEANNQKRMQKALSGLKGQVFVPDVMLELSTRRVLVSEWVDGIKLTKADPAEVGRSTERFVLVLCSHLCPAA